MKKFGKMGIVAAAASLIAALSVSTAAPAVSAADDKVVMPKGFEAESVEIKGKNEALTGWQYYFYNDRDADGKERAFSYESDNLHVLATTEGRTGNALHLKREKADGELVMYSYAFDVTPDQNYVIGAFVKSICAQAAGNRVYFKVKEQSANGNVVNDENAILHSVDGRRDDWTETTFSYKTSVSAETIILKICAEGVGDFYVDDITVKPSNAAINTVKFGLQSFGTANYDWQLPVAERPAERLTSAQISGESSDNDGASLKLDTGKYFSNYFGMLPHDKSYTLSFKYKTAYAGRLAVRIDNMNPAGNRSWYADEGNIAIAPSGEWQTYTYSFTTQQGQTDVQWMEMNFADCASDAYILIDELKVVGTDDDGKTMQYIANGSFSGAYTEGYFYENNANIAKQEDGSSVIMIGNANLDKTSGAAGYLDIDTTHLTTGKTYTLKFDYRAGEAESSARIYYGTYWNDQVALNVSAPAHNLSSWASASVDFVAGAEVTDIGDHTTVRNSSRLEIYSQPYGKPTYMRNFSIVDEDGNEFITNKTLVAPEVVLGENEFPYGTFEGDVNYVAEDWTFEGDGNIYGLVFDTRWEPDAKPDWKICLSGTEETPAIAISKEIAVSKRTLMVGCKIYTGNVKFSVIVGDQEIATDENGFIELPEGTTTVRIKCTATEYVAFKYLMLGTHTHATPEEGATTTEAATCTKIGGTFYYCADCEKNVYIEKIPMLPHDLEHVHEDATCRDGVDKDVCKICKQEFNVEVIPATGEHDYETKVIRDATCTASGMKHDVCKVCGSEGNVSVIPKKAHDYKNGKCTVCGAEDPDYEPTSESTSEPTSESTGEPTSDEPASGSTSEEPASGSESEKPSESKGSGTSAGKKGCGSNVYGGVAALGVLALAAFVLIKRKKD